MKTKSQKIHTKALLKSDIKALLIFFLAANLFTVYFINREKCFYFWDYANYWLKYLLISDTFKGNPYQALRSVVTTVRYSDYNYIAALILIPFKFLFGAKRLPYILSIVNIFALPAGITFLILNKKIISKVYAKLPPVVSYIPIITVLFFPLFWGPTFQGYVAVGGICLINIVLLVYISKPFSEQSIINLIIIGLLIPVLVLFRRWYAYWCVAFYFAVVLNEFIFSFVNRKFDYKKFSISIKNVSISIFVSAIFFFAAATPIAIKMATTDYSDIYSAYKISSNIFESFGKVLSHFGIIYMSIFFLGAIHLFLRRKTRKISTFLSIQWLVIFILFSRTQDFDSQHYYLLQPTMLLFTSLYITDILLQNIKIKKAFVSIYVLISLMVFLTVSIPQVSRYTKIINDVLPKTRYYPVERNDIDEVGRLLDVMKELLNKKENHAYILSSSKILNGHMVQCAYLSLGRPRTIEDQILHTHDIDKRDCFPSNFLDAKYVVVGIPTQYHLRAKDQRVIGVLVNSLIKKQNIGLSYKRLAFEFILDKNVRVHIYEKIKPFSKTSIDSLSEIFRRYYPDKKCLYEIPFKVTLGKALLPFLKKR